jgi:hypothetical protein
MADESVKVKVGADFSQAEKAAEKSGEKISGMQKYFGDYMGSLKEKLLQGLALESLVDKSIETVKAAFDWTSELRDISERTGTSMDQLQRLGAVGKKTGVSMESLGRMLSFANKSIGAAEVKASDHRAVLAELGFTTEQVVNKQVKAEMVFQALAESHGRGAEAATLQRQAQVLLGRSSMQNMQIFKMNGLQMKTMMENVTVFSDEQIRAMDRTARAFERAGNEWEKMKRRIAINLFADPSKDANNLIRLGLTKDTGFFGGIEAETDPAMVRARLLKQIGTAGYDPEDLQDFIDAIEKAKKFRESEGFFDEFSDEGIAAAALSRDRGISGVEKDESGKAYITGNKQNEELFMGVLREIMQSMTPTSADQDKIAEGVAKGTSLQAVGGGDWITSNTISATERIATATEASQRELASINQKTLPGTNNKTNIAK